MTITHLNKLKDKSLTIGIVGLGYLGLPLAMEFGKQYQTIGFDINAFRVKELYGSVITTGTHKVSSIKMADSQYVLPEVPVWADLVWQLYVIRTPRRDALQAYLTDRGVGTLVHYPTPPHLQRAYAELGYKRGDFPIAEKIADEVHSLPIEPHLSFEQQDQVIAALLDFQP